MPFLPTCLPPPMACFFLHAFSFLPYAISISSFFTNFPPAPCLYLFHHKSLILFSYIHILFQYINFLYPFNIYLLLTHPILWSLFLIPPHFSQIPRFFFKFTAAISLGPIHNLVLKQSNICIFFDL